MPYKNKTEKPANGRAGKPVDIITIDGPAGSGKSTVAKEVAKKLGFFYIDTGAMYRALALKAIKEDVDLRDKDALAQLARMTDIRLQMGNDNLQVILDGKDVSRAIRKQSLTEKVHFVACVPDVRNKMVKLQRELAQKAKGAVLEGRDLGTVVFPNAKHKFYLDAQPQERIRRRYKELKQMGQNVSPADIAEDINKRDKSDMNRNIAPLLRAKDAFYVDTTELSINEVVEQIINIVWQCYT